MFDVKTAVNNKLLIVFTTCLLKAYPECVLVLSLEELFQQCFILKNKFLGFHYANQNSSLNFRYYNVFLAVMPL